MERISFKSFIDVFILLIMPQVMSKRNIFLFKDAMVIRRQVASA